MSRWRPLLSGFVGVCVGSYFTLSDDAHRRRIGTPRAPTSKPAELGRTQESEEEAPAAFNASHYPNGLNAGFIKRDKDQIKAFYEPRFEMAENRDIAANQDRILQCLGDLQNDVVVDVGAGTGFFIKALSERVGASGLVVATDLASGMCDLLRDRIRDEEVTNAVVYQSTERSLALPPTLKANVVFLCDVYHHFTYPQTFMRDIAAHLQNGGRLVLIDFHRDPAKMLPGHDGNWVLDHVRADKDVFQSEIEACGFKVVAEPEAGLTENYIIVFEKQE